MDNGKNRTRKRGKTSRKCNKYNLTIVNTVFTPKKGMVENLETWRSGDGGIQRQLDYIIISEENKNRVRSAKTKGQSNINQMRQRKILRMEINISIKSKKKKRGNT